MIILHNDRVEKSEKYVERYGDSHDVLVWPEMTGEERKSFMMMAGQSPREFPAVYDRSSGVMVEKASQAPTKAISGKAAEEEEKETAKAQRKAAKDSIRQRKADKLVEKLQKGQGATDIRLERVEKVLARIVETIS